MAPADRRPIPSLSHNTSSPEASIHTYPPNVKPSMIIKMWMSTFFFLASDMEQAITNIMNMLDPLSFTLKMFEEKNCNMKVENVKIVDDIIQINGKIFVKGD